MIAEFWGRDDWEKLGDMKDAERAEAFCERFRSELGYESALQWPIYSKADGGRIAYHMIHATDHPDAPKLMHRAYRRAVLPKERPEQLGIPGL